jgi:hypothetical protein
VRLALVVALGALATPRLAGAGVAEWRLSETMLAGAGGDGQVRFVEVHTIDGGCWFPTTQIAVYDGAGTVLDAVAPFVETTCFGADTYLVLATAQAEATFGVTAAGLPPAAPAAARQMCLRSSATLYDCVRWDGVTVPVHDLFGPADDSTAVAPPAGLALARIAESHVVAEDWIVAEPTPAAVNDGTPWDPPDAGPTPDAGADAAVPDAGAAPDGGAGAPDAADPDARDDRFLDLDAGGGAGCGCASSSPRGGDLVLVVLVLAVLRRFR